MAQGSQIQTTKIATYNLGEKGVVITKSPVHVEAGDLALAQNAVPNPEGGLSGLRKRFGFQALNASAAAGGIMAFISCNLEDPGVVAVNPAAFGKWLYSADGGTTWSYLEVQQTATSIPINYDSVDRLAFLHLTKDTDKTGTIAIDQVAGENQWETSAIPAAGDDPGRVAYTIPHTIDLTDEYFYYWAADGLSVRRWSYGVDAELCDLSGSITGIVDWDTDGTNIWLLTTVAMGGGLPDTQQVYKITVSTGTAAKVGAALDPAGAGYWVDQVTRVPTRQYYTLAVIKLNGTTPTVILGGSQYSTVTTTQEVVQTARVDSLAGDASDVTAVTARLSAYDTKNVPTGNAYATLTCVAALDMVPYVGAAGPYQKCVQFAVGDTITIGDTTYTAVSSTTPTSPNEFFRGGVISTGTRSVLIPPSPTGPTLARGISFPQVGTVASYEYMSGLQALAFAISGGASASTVVGTGTVSHPLVFCSYATLDQLALRVTSRATGSAGNGITVSETSAVASWGGTNLAGGVYLVTAQANKVKVHDIIDDGTIGAFYCALTSTGGHSEIKKCIYPIVGGGWTPAWTDVRTQTYPFGYISAWADNSELLFLETPEAIALHLSKGVKVGSAVFFLIGTGIATSADINLIALSSGALQRIELP